jgi:L-ascorbate metabolism protein UlaG (beta-lactamase superfamily)
VDLPVTDVELVQALIAQTQKTQNLQISLAESIREAFRLILKQADGFSIEKFYPMLPENIRGYVELTYTLGNFPNLRVIESLLYQSEFNTKRLQTSRIFLSNDDDRPFIFSTPRLLSHDSIELNFSFDSPIYDFLAKLRNEPCEYEKIIETLQLTGKQAEMMKTFLVEKPKSIASDNSPHSFKTSVRYFGHACVLIESADRKSILIDPVVSYVQHGGIKRFVLADMPDHIDYVVLTHNHADHVMIESLLALRHKIGSIVIPSGGGGLADPSLRLMLQSIGFSKVLSLESLDTIEEDLFQITALPFLGEHGDLDIYTKAAWLIRVQDKNFLFAADSNNLDPKMYEHIRNLFGSIEILFLGMECLGAPLSWTYGPYLPITIDRKKDQSRRLNGSDSARGMQLIQSLGCKTVYIYAMGAEPWLQFLTSIDPDENTIPKINARELIAACNLSNIHAELLFGSAQMIYE